VFERLGPANLCTAFLGSRLAFTPADLRVAATSSPADTLRLVRITRAPACAKARAVSTPMPELPPDQREAGIVQVELDCRNQIRARYSAIRTCDNRCLSCEVSSSQRLYSSGSGPEYWRHKVLVKIFWYTAPVCRAMRSFELESRL